MLEPASAQKSRHDMDNKFPNALVLFLCNAKPILVPYKHYKYKGIATIDF